MMSEVISANMYLCFSFRGKSFRNMKTEREDGSAENRRKAARRRAVMEEDDDG